MKTDLIILFSFYSASITSTLGYGLYLQKIINIPSKKKCLGYSLLIGFFFLTIYSYISNFLYKHDIYHNLIILILGICLFYLNDFKKKILKFLLFYFYYCLYLF